MLIDDIIKRKNELHSPFDERSFKDRERVLKGLSDFGNGLRERARTKSTASHDKLLVDAYALVCEVARIVVKEHPNVRRQQIEAAIELDKGRIVEMQNGEGKTLAATMPAYLNSLKEGHSVHIATYNDYLARRDALWMGPIYLTLGLNVGVIIDSENVYRVQHAPMSSSEFPGLQDGETAYILTECTPAGAYECDIVYGTHEQFALDYLHDNMVTHEADMVQRRLDFIILDEADSVLIENAHAPVHVVEPRPVDAWKYRSLYRVANELQTPLHYKAISNSWNIEMTPDGVEKAELLLRQEDILSTTGQLYSKDSPAIASQLIQALQAKEFYHRDHDYIVIDGCVKGLNPITGRRVKHGSYQKGIQQAIEAREGVKITELNVVKASISYQHFFNHYEKMAGMTATAQEHRQELRVVYNKQIAVIDPFKISQRHDLDDLTYKTSEGRLQGVVDEIVKRHEQGHGRPLLINVANIEQADELAQHLTEHSIPHQVLHAKHEDTETEIIEQAGQRGKVTVVAEMAGRGTDIQIDQEVELLGGLHVIGVGRHMSRYMDNQLIGRAGRQGKRGSSQFFLSTDDPLIKYSSYFDMPALMQQIGVNDDAPTVNRIIELNVEQTQKRNKLYYFQQRRLVYERERLLYKQRESIYRVRHKIVTQKNISEELAAIRTNVVVRTIQRFLSEKARKQERIEELASYFYNYNHMRFPRSDFDFLEEKGLSWKHVRPQLVSLLDSAYKEQRTSFGDAVAWIQEERRLLLSHLDSEWVEFLARLDELQEENMLRAHIEEQSFEWYAVESFRCFQETMERIEEGFLRDIFSLE